MKLDVPDARALVHWLSMRSDVVPAFLAQREHDARVLAFLEHHRLGGRFLARASGKLNPGPLQSALAEKQAAVAHRLSVALADLAAALHGQPHRDVIVLKGPTASVLSGNPSHVRQSGDVDIWSPEPHELVRCLLASGGRQRAVLIAQHEVASIDLNGMKMDVHDYVPAAHYTSLASPPSISELAVSRSQISERCAVKPLRLPPLLEAGTVQGTLPAPLRVFSATAGALICCTALTTDLAWEPFVAKSARLVALFEAHDMSTHPSFDLVLFRELVRATGLEPNVRACARALQAYFPHGPLSAFSDGRAGLTQKLSNAGYGPWISRNIDDVFLVGPRSIYDATSRISTPVSAGTDGASVVPDARIIRWSDSADAGPRSSLKLSRDGERVVLEVSGETSGIANVLLMFENGLHCDVVISKDAAPRSFAGKGTEFDYHVGERSVRLSVGCGPGEGGRVRGVAVVGGRSAAGGSWSRVAPLLVADSEGPRA